MQVAPAGSLLPPGPGVIHGRRRRRGRGSTGRVCAGTARRCGWCCIGVGGDRAGPRPFASGRGRRTTRRTRGSWSPTKQNAKGMAPPLDLARGLPIVSVAAFLELSAWISARGDSPSPPGEASCRSTPPRRVPPPACTSPTDPPERCSELERRPQRAEEPAPGSSGTNGLETARQSGGAT